MVKLPYLEVSGNNFDLGSAIGEAFKDKIRKRIKRVKESVKDYDSYLDSCYSFYQNAYKFFPELIEETVAISSAAGVPFKEYFLLNTPEVYHRARSMQGLEPQRCTVAISKNKDGFLIGHNEDWSREEMDDLYILKATVNGVRFLGLQYSSELPGTSATINNFGLVQCINDMHSPIQKGVPRNFIARAVIVCKSLEEVLSLLKKTKQASGYNHCLILGDKIWDIEVAGDLVNLKKIVPPFVHTNHYLSKLKQSANKPSAGSKVRFNKATELIKKEMTIDQMKGLLSECECSNFTECELSYTIASVIITPGKKELLVSRNGAVLDNFISYSL